MNIQAHVCAWSMNRSKKGDEFPRHKGQTMAWPQA
jgi:hypothetical protein